MYTNLEARIITDRIGEYLVIGKGVKQGHDPLSALLFICPLEQIFKKLNWDDEGILVNGERLNNLWFSDDIVLITDNINELRVMIQERNEVGKEAELTIDIAKTKILTKNTETDFLIDNQNIEKVTGIIYLGQLISFENRTEKEVNRRITLTWKKFLSLKLIFNGPFRTYQK